TTGSQSFRTRPARKADIVIRGVFLVNSGAANTRPVLTGTPGATTTYQRVPSFTGDSCSPTPSPQALSPRTNTGTSAPSRRPSWLKASTSSPVRQSAFSATSVVAASELPPPSPPPIGNRLSI